MGAEKLALASIPFALPGLTLGAIWLSIDTGKVDERKKEDLEKKKKAIGIAAAALLGFVALMWIIYFATQYNYYSKRGGKWYSRLM